MTLRFTLRQIHYFVTVAEVGSISRASERLNISPPSLSTAIGQLEAAFGIRLFIRQHSQGLSLTGEGRRFLNEAKQLLAQASAMHRSANEISHELRGPLSVGCHVSFSAMLLPTIRRSVEAAHRNITWSSTTGDQAALIDRLHAGEIDAALVFDLGIPRDLVFEPLSQLKTHAIMAADHPLASQASVSLEELSEQPLILLELPLQREYFLGLFEAAGCEPNVYDRVADANLLRAMVAGGHGYSLANVRPLNAAAADGRAIVMKPLSDVHAPVSIGLVAAHGSFRPKVVSAFMAQCRRLIHDDVIPGMAPPPSGEITERPMSLAG
jgi:DNA-binding transcriptional LysR family regulator